MFTTAWAFNMRKELLSINPKWADDDNLILRAYLSHKIRARRKNYSDDDLKALGNYVLEPFFKDGPEAEKTTVDNIRNTFRTCRTIEQFINLFIPDLVVDIDALKSISEPISGDQVSLLLNILTVKNLTKNLNLFLKNDENSLWESYVNEVSSFPKSIALFQSRQELNQLIHALFSVDIGSGSNTDVFSDESETVRIRLLRIASIFFDDLQLSRSQALRICAKHIEFKRNRKLIEDEAGLKDEVEYLLDEIPISDFLSRETATQKIRNAIEKLCNELNHRAINSNPIDLHCALYLYKKQVYDIGLNNDPKRSKPKRRLSVDVEDTVAFNLFTQELYDGENYRILLLLPSPFFIRKYGNNDYTRNLQTTVVVPDENYLAICSGQYANNPDSTKRNHNFTFITVDRYLGSDIYKSDYDRVLYFENHTDSIRETDFERLGRNIALSQPRNHLFVFSDKKNGSSDKAFFDTILRSSDWTIDNILQLPAQDPSVSGNTIETMLWEASLNAEDKTNTTTSLCIGRKSWKRRRKKTSTQDDSGLFNGRRIVIDYDKYDEINLSTHCISNRKSIWNIVKSQESKDDDERNRIVHHFSNEIDMFCSFRNLKTDGTFFADGYTCLPDATAGKRGTKIPNSEKRVPIKFSTPEMISGWLANVYPFETFREYEGQKRKPIRAVVSEAFIPVLQEKQISFKSFWYIYEIPLDEIEKSNDFGRIQDVFMEFAFSDYGNRLLDDISLEDYKTFLENIDLERYETTEDKALMAFSEALDVAIEKGHCSVNTISIDDEEADGLITKSLNAIKESLKKKSMTEAEFRYSFISLKTKEMLSEGDYGILIRLFTGLETNIVSGLRWEDFIYIRDFGFYVLDIFKAIEDNGCEKKLKTINGFRVIPCSSHLSELLVQKKKRQRATGKDFIIHGDGPGGLFKPTKLAKECREFVSGMGFDDVIVSIDSGKGYREENLSAFRGNLFKQNIRYWLINKAGFIPDEMRYFLGLKPTTTIFTNYIDMTDECSLYALYVKLRRLDALLEFGSDKTEYAEESVEKEGSISFNENTYLPAEILIEFNSETDLNLEIDHVQHGLMAKQL